MKLVEKQVWAKGAQVLIQDDQAVAIRRTIKCFGTLVTDSGSMALEVSQRTGRARAECVPIKRALAKRDNIPLTNRVRYWEAYALSTMLYNICVWNPLPQKSIKKLLGAQTRVYRSAMGLAVANNAELQVSHNQVLTQARRLDI